MQVKKSKITIHLSEEEKNTINNFYDFLDDRTRELYEAEAEHTEFCSTLVHIMEEIMTLYDFWGDILEEKLKHEDEEPWDYIHEMMEKFLFYDYDDNLIPYPNITVGLSVRDWVNEFCKIYDKASALRVLGELSRPAFDFFITNTEFVLLDAKVGYYTYDSWTHEWSRVFSNREKMKFVEELDNKYVFISGAHTVKFLSTPHFIDWKEDFLKQSETFTDVVISSPLSDEAQQFFSQKWGFNLPYEKGTYTYNRSTGEWGKV